MAKINIDKTRKALQSFDFKTLFIEELGWSNPVSTKTVNETIKENTISRKPIAELAGAVVFEISASDGSIPEPKQRAVIAKEIQKLHYENVLIFLDKDRTQSIWHWRKNQDKKIVSREHFYIKGQPGDLFISKISSLVFDISEFDEEGNIPIAEVASRIKSALDIERVTKKFFREYQTQFISFIDFIEGIDNEADKHWYASVILNRLMFIYFLQKKLFLDNGNGNYLSDKLQYSKDQFGKNKFYDTFLNKLFFEGFAKAEAQRDVATNKLIGKIKYLNGGLFLEHKIEKKYKSKIKIKDDAFENLFALFDSYSWTLDDTPGGNDNEINPDVLGYIFEKYINQKAFGAYYTRTEITEYLCEQTVYKLILDEVNEPEIEPELLKKSGLDKYGKAKHYTNISELLLHLDASICKKLIVGENAVLPNLSLLDPACGSGAFLVAAMKTLINVYAAILGKIDFLGDKKLIEWKKEIEQNHPSINYYIKKQIITNNLYGVDIMEEATEIAKLRLFLALVASAQTVDQLEPLPNIDFNIMSGNSLIGLMRVDEGEYNKHQGADLFKKSYRELVNQREAAIRAYKSFENTNENVQIKKESIELLETEANDILNIMLGHEFNNLGIQYEQITWDDKKNKEGKSIKRKINLSDIKALEPFHWGYEFSEIFRKKNGFDAIITNPPWETFQPNTKEFLMKFSKTISKKKMDIKDFVEEFQTLMEDKSIRAEWLKYSSNYNHLREYFRFSPQYKNQVPIIDGKRHGKDVNLYKLFSEQSFNLLKKGGYCGIVIPSGIYSDLGSKQLREMLFENSTVTGIFCFENRKEIFEGVHRSFKFVVLSFEKGGKTQSFPTAFMRHDVEELANFPQFGSINISLDFIKKQSPQSLSVMEVKNEMDFIIANKLLKFPTLNDANNKNWVIELHREFNMTDDAPLFNKTSLKNSLPLYEGKMIFNYTHLLAEPKYWIKESEGRKALIKHRQEDDGQIIGYQKFRLAYRSVASNTNERTMVCTVIPPAFTGNSLNVSENLDYVTQFYCASMLSSFVIDWFIRQNVTTNINMFYVYQLPVPRLKLKDKWYKPIVERAAKLICTTAEFSDLWEEVMKSKWSEKLVATQEYERNQLRAELDGIIAHIYGLTEEEFAYILSTFPIVPQPHKVSSQNAYRDVLNGIIK